MSDEKPTISQGVGASVLRLENDRCLRRSWPVHGQNGIGEGGAIGPLAAIANAVNDALAPLGVEVGTLPMTPV
jgi:hypothetical protein